MITVWGFILARTVGLAGVGRKRVAHALLFSYGEAFLLLLPSGIFYWCVGWRSAAVIALTLAGVIYLVILDRRRPEIRKKLRRLIRK